MRKKFIFKKSNSINNFKVAIIGIIMATFFWLGFYSKHLKPKILVIADNRSNELIYRLLNNTVNTCIKNINQNNLLIFKKNNSDEIVLTQYNLNEIYKLYNEFNKSLSRRTKSFTIFIPGGMISNRFLINNWGSKIPVKATLENNIYVNIETKVTNYGINNALVEMYFVVNTSQYVIVPFDKKPIKKEYKILISTYFVNGKVPSYYGGSYRISSNIFDIYSKI